VSTPELSRLLAEIGLMAAGYGLNEHADAILAAVQDTSPSSAAPVIGRALILMNGGQHDEAALLLERAVAAVDERDRAAVRSLRGWALQKAGMAAESERVLSSVAEGEGGPAELASALLGNTGRR
jgi:hypothetical protein